MIETLTHATSHKRLAFKTFGCKANSVDTDALYLEAQRRGFHIVDEDELADAYVINSCTVTGAADRDARYAANRYKRRNPAALVAIVGCYAQVARDELLALSEIDFCVGTANKFRVLDHLSQAWKEDGRTERDQVEIPRGFLPESFPGSRHARASIKVQDGCNFHCSFCIIPDARGRSRSLSPDTILRQIDEAYRQGFREVVLTGIHLAHYGWDQNTDLMSLLKRIFATPEGPRIRLTTLDPFEIPDELVDMLGRESRLCPHFHIAIQSGSDRILARMRRIYKAKEFAEVTSKIQSRYPDTFVGIDVIVGFPGEGEPEFQETLSLLQQSFWSKLHVFPFSLRRGTRAETLDGQVTGADIRDRSQRLRTLSDSRYESFLRSQLGKEREVILERPLRQDPAVWQGHTDNYLPTNTRATNVETKAAYRVRLERVDRQRVETSPIR